MGMTLSVVFASRRCQIMEVVSATTLLPQTLGANGSLRSFEGNPNGNEPAMSAAVDLHQYKS
jgi:hypothetical protein